MFKISAKAIPLRAPALSYDEVGPGLYPDETLVEVGKSLVAVSAKPARTPNGGVVITGWARWVMADGTTRFDEAGNEIEIEYRPSFDVGFVDLVGIEVLARAVLFSLLGAPPVMRTAEGAGENGEDIEVPVLQHSDELAAAISIQKQIELTRLTAGEFDAGKVLV